MSLAENVKNLRLAQGYTQSELAYWMDVSRQRVTELEGGQGNPTLKTLFRLASVLAVPAYMLLIEDDQEEI